MARARKDGEQPVRRQRAQSKLHPCQVFNIRLTRYFRKPQTTQIVELEAATIVPAVGAHQAGNEVENVPAEPSTQVEVVSGKRKRRETARRLGESPSVERSPCPRARMLTEYNRDFCAAKKLKARMAVDVVLPIAEASLPAPRKRARTRL